MVSTLFVDESLHRGFRLAAVRIESSGVSRARAKMHDQLPPGTRRLHFVKENDTNRRRAFAAIERLGLNHVLIESPAFRHALDQRITAIRRLVEWAVDEGIQRLVFERDDNSVMLDRRTIADTLAKLGRADAIEYVHVGASAEPLRWIPDAVAWAWSRGGEWRLRAEALHLVRITA